MEQHRRNSFRKLVSAEKQNKKYTFMTVLQRRSDLCIPRNQTARRQSQSLHSYICEQFINSHDRSAYFAAAKYTDRSWENINRSQIFECRNWD